MSWTLSIFKTEAGISLETLQPKGLLLALRGESPPFYRVVAGNLGFLSSSDEDLRDPVLWPQESPVSMQIARGLSGFLRSHCWGRVSHLDLTSETHISAPMPTWISAFLWSFHREVRPRLVWKHASLVSSRAGKSVRLPVVLT